MRFLERGMKMLMVSSYPERECGLATFSNDIVNALKKVFGHTLPVEICALENEQTQLSYPSEVSYRLYTNKIKNYREIAEKINEREDIGLVCFQHEFGLYGGNYGDYLLAFLLALNKPVAIVFHTVLPEPNSKIKKLVKIIAQLSDKIIVLTNHSKKILNEQYRIQNSKMIVIPHGTHVVLWNQKEHLKIKHQLVDKIVLSTFGLLSENKSIETVLLALPEIVKKHDNIMYLIIGKTHPEIIKNEGEKYRNHLIKMVEELQLSKNVIFVNEYVELHDLLEYLSLSDIYLFTSKDPNQAVSGTLSYAMGCGCAVISNPIPHAVELLSGDRGVLLKKFNDTDEFRNEILNLLKNDELRISIAKNAFSYMHNTTWENIAIKYGLLFGEMTDRLEDLRFKFPPVKLDHILQLTTDKGILQFSDFSKPNPKSGYTIDDNARALINMVMHYNLYQDEQALKLAEIYLSFIESMQRKDGWFDNYMSLDHKITAQNSEVNLEDANGRTLWSLGNVIANKQKLPLKLVNKAHQCWLNAMPKIEAISSPRAVAYAIKGLYSYYQTYPDNIIKQRVKLFSDQLLNHYNINSEEEWQWYEDYLTYANNVLPEAMMYSYLITGDKTYKKIAEVTLDFLLSQYFMKGRIKVISNRGWFKKKNERVFYGEQPIEVATTIIVLDLFYNVTRKNKYKSQLEIAFSWFLGNNHLKQIMYNTQNGASYDGLEDTHININQGAESTLCFMKAQMIMEKNSKRMLPTRPQKVTTKIPIDNRFSKTFRLTKDKKIREEIKNGR